MLRLAIGSEPRFTGRMPAPGQSRPESQAVFGQRPMDTFQKAAPDTVRFAASKSKRFTALF